MAKSNPAQFSRQVRQETAKVTWPTRKETIVTAIMVAIMSAIMAVFFLATDQIIQILRNLLFGLVGS